MITLKCKLKIGLLRFVPEKSQVKQWEVSKNIYKKNTEALVQEYITLSLMLLFLHTPL